MPRSTAAPERGTAIDLIKNTVEASAEPITLLGLGPLTNIALFLRAYPEHARQLARIVFMGGSASVGNTSAVAEFNAAAPYRRLGLAGKWPLAVAAAYR